MTYDVTKHEKWKFLFFFNRERQALVFTPLKGLIFIKRWITVQPKFLSLNAKLSVRDIWLIAFVNFSYSSGCDLHDRSQKYQKKKVTAFRFGTSHFSY